MQCKCIGCRIGQPCVVEALIAHKVTTYSARNKTGNLSFDFKCEACGVPRSNGSKKHCRRCHIKEVTAGLRFAPVVNTCERCARPKSSGRGRFCRGCYNTMAAQRKSHGNLVKDGRPRAASLSVNRVWVAKPQPLPIPRPYESVMNEPPPAARKVLSRTDVTSRFFNDPR